MGQRQLLRGILIGLGLLAAMTVWLVSWLLTQSPVSLLLASPDLPPIVGFAPRSTEALLLLATPLEDLQAFLQAATPASKRRATRQRWQQFFSAQGPGWLGSILAGGSLNFEREVRPWLGETSLVALLPQLGTLVVLETGDPAVSQFDLNLLWERQSLAGLPVEVQTYKGIQVVSSPLGDLEGFSAAIFGERYVLLAEQAAAIREAIDAWQLPQLSLVVQPRFQQVIEPLQEAHIGWAFWQNVGFPAENALSLQAVGLGLGLNFHGLVAQSAALWYAPAGFPLPTAEAFRPQILKHLPDEALALISGQNLASVWRSLGQIQPIDTAPIGSLVDPGQWLNRLQSQVDLDWQRLLPETGEFAFALLPNPTGSPPGDRDPAWLLVSELRDNSGSSLEEAVQAQGWQVVSIPLAKGSAMAWAKPWGQDQQQTPSAAETQPTHSTHRPEVPILAALDTAIAADSPDSLTFSKSAEQAETIPESLEGIPEPPGLLAQVYHIDHKGYCYLASSLRALESALQDPPLSADRAWRRLVAPLPHRNLGYGYGSLGALLEVWLPNLKGSRLASTRFALTTTALSVSEAPYPALAAQGSEHHRGRWLTQEGKLFWQWY
ncbi:MAG: DUF3352 domain-containing protein [Thermostichus sp. HHBFW_bins_43]